MGKKALAIRSMEADTVLAACQRSSDYTYSPTLEQMRLLYQLRSSLLDRDTCETDLTWVQWLVYIRLSYEVPSATIENGVDQYVFLYQRGKAGGEIRLHDDWSIGLGGHVEEPTTPARSNLAVLAESAQRELIEEVKIELDISVFEKALMQPIVMRDNRTATEAVHLGLFIDIRIDPPKTKVVEGEANVIEKGQWVLLRDVQERHATGGFVPRLEPWSQAFQRIPLPTARHFADLAS